MLKNMYACCSIGHSIFNSRNQERTSERLDSFGHLEDAATDGHITGEGALLVDVVALLRRLGGLEPETDVLYEAHALALCIKRVRDAVRKGEGRQDKAFVRLVMQQSHKTGRCGFIST